LSGRPAAPIVGAMQRRSLALATASGGAFLGFLDTTIVNVAFPDVSASFAGAGRAQVSWVLDGYFIVFAALLVPAGALADRYGRKRLFLAGVAGFVLASALCALAPSWQALVAARVLQAAAAAVLTPASLALVLAEFPQRERAAAVAAWSAWAALAAASGPPLGGALVELAGWRWIFLVNLPLGALVIVLGLRTLAESRDPGAAAVPDLLGSALAALSLGLLALGIVEGSAPVLGAAVVLGAVLARRCANHARPVVDPALLRIPSFRRGSLGALVFSAALFAVLLGNVLFLTGIWGYSVLDAGLAAVPGALAATVVARPAGRLADRFGHRAVIVPGALLFAAGALGLRAVTTEPDFLGAWVPWTVTTGLGIGMALPMLSAAAVSDVEPERFGVASAVSSAFRQIGAVVGTALLVAIVGDPGTLAEGMARADRAYLLASLGSLAAAAIALGLRPVR
jgi:EmrB/QacA subfamily drug resistance transporter